MMEHQQNGGVALITGGGGGFGQAFAKILLETKLVSGVMLADLDEQLARTAAQELRRRFRTDRVLHVRCDVTKERDIENALQLTSNKLGKVSVFVNNAGIARGGFNDYELVVAVDLVSVIAGTKLAYEHMTANQVEGTIVNVASYGGLVPMPFDPVYAASKAGVHFSRSCSFMGDEGIRVNALCPSFADTPLVRNSLGAGLKDVVSSTDSLMTPAFVAEAFLELVRNKSYCGDVMSVKTNSVTVKGKGNIILPTQTSPKL